VKSPPEYCPNCGAAVPRKALACPECGADESTGWAEKAAASGLDLPDQDFDYDEFVKREFDHQAERLPRGIKPLWWIVALVVALLLLIGLLK
jgi:hypothetical protein